MPSCEHPQGEARCPNHGPAWIDRTNAVLDEIAEMTNWRVYETLPEAVRRALDEAAATTSKEQSGG